MAQPLVWSATKTDSRITHLSNSDTKLRLASSAVEHFIAADPAVSLANTALKRQPICFLPQPTFISVNTSTTILLQPPPVSTQNIA